MSNIFNDILSRASGGVLGFASPAQPPAQGAPVPVPRPTERGTPAPSQTNRLFQNKAFLSALNSFGQALAQPGQVPGQAINTGQRLVQGLGAFNQQFAQQQQVQQAAQQKKAEALSAEAFKEREVALKEKEFGLDLKEFEAKASGGTLDPKELFDRGTKLRGEFTNLTKDFIKQRDAFARIQTVVEQIRQNPEASGVGDIALIFNFMKVQDPGSTVREGEFATAENSAGVVAKFRNQYNKALRGDRLTSKQRDEFLNTSRGIFESAEEQHNQRVQTFTGLSQRLGVDPQNVVLDFGIAKQKATEERAAESVPTGQSILQQTPIPQQSFPQQNFEGFKVRRRN